MFCLPQPCPLSTVKTGSSLSTDSSSDNDMSKAVLATPQAGWEKDTGRVGGLKSPPHLHRNNKRLGREQDEGGGGGKSGNGEGLSWGPGGRTSVTSATLHQLQVCLPQPCPLSTVKTGSSLSADSTFSARGCAPVLLCPASCPTLPPGRVTETPRGADHFRQPFITLISCLYPHLATPFGLVDRLSPQLEAWFPATGSAGLRAELTMKE